MNNKFKKYKFDLRYENKSELSRKLKISRPTLIALSENGIQIYNTNGLSLFELPELIKFIDDEDIDNLIEEIEIVYEKYGKIFDELESKKEKR